VVWQGGVRDREIGANKRDFLLSSLTSFLSFLATPVSFSYDKIFSFSAGYTKHKVQLGLIQGLG
jgi:hypothetical protein